MEFLIITRSFYGVGHSADFKECKCRVKIKDSIGVYRVATNSKYGPNTKYIGF